MTHLHKKMKYVWLIDGATHIKIGTAMETSEGWLIELAAFPLSGRLELRDVLQTPADRAPPAPTDAPSTAARRQPSSPAQPQDPSPASSA